MSHSELNIIVLAAGKGTRMKSSLHKVLHPVAGKSMIHHLLDSVNQLGPHDLTLVIGSNKEQLKSAVPNVNYAEQNEQLGTGHAVMMARDFFRNKNGDTLVLYGDVPFIPKDVMEKMITARHRDLQGKKPAMVVLGFEAEDPGKYGRLILSPDGTLEKIVEYKDAREEEKAITLCNSGMMIFDTKKLDEMLDHLSNDNAAREYYLTDLVEIARSKEEIVAVTMATEDDVMGVNSRSDLAVAESVFQNKLRQKAMDEGVTLVDPSTVYFSADTEIASDVTIEPNVFFGTKVKISSGCVIKANSHIEGTTIGEDAQIGPFARLRPGTHLDDKTKIGNFVETKKTYLGTGSKINHLSYIGNAEVGQNVNIGAGTITCNYDGFNKYKTMINDGVFIGTNTSLIAPVSIGSDAMTAAGSVIDKDIPAEALAIERTKQVNKEKMAVKFMAKAKAKAKKDKK